MLHGRNCVVVYFYSRIDVLCRCVVSPCANRICIASTQKHVSCHHQSICCCLECHIALLYTSIVVHMVWCCLCSDTNIASLLLFHDCEQQRRTIEAYIFVCFICCGCKIHLRPLADVASVLDHPYAMIAIPSIKNAPTTTVETRNTNRTTNIGEYSETCSFASKLIRNNICYRLRHRIILPLLVQYNWKENVHRINIAQWTLFILHSIIMLCGDPDTIIKWQRAELSQFVRCDIQRRHTPNRENSNGR